MIRRVENAVVFVPFTVAPYREPRGTRHYVVPGETRALCGLEAIFDIVNEGGPASCKGCLAEQEKRQ